MENKYYSADGSENFLVVSIYEWNIAVTACYINLFYELIQIFNVIIKINNICHVIFSYNPACY